MRDSRAVKILLDFTSQLHSRFVVNEPWLTRDAPVAIGREIFEVDASQYTVGLSHDESDTKKKKKRKKQSA